MQPSRPDGRGKRVAIVASSFNGEIVEKLLTAGREELLALGVTEEDVDTFRVPGAFELPIAAKRAAGSGRYDGVLALGAVVKGETSHNRYVADAAVQGLARVALDESLPVALGVLTTDTYEQARERAGGKQGNRGRDAARALLQTIALLERT